MKLPTSKSQTSRSTRWRRVIWYGAAGLLGVATVAVAAVFFWPTYLPALRQAPVHADLSYDQAAVEAQTMVDLDTADPNVLPDCRSIFLKQPSRTAKAVVLLHGYTDCPSQMQGLATTMYAMGYTVLVPRAPIHGEYNHQQLMAPVATELTAYASRSATIIKGLDPKDAGAVGLSGGGVLTSWLAYYRSDAIKQVEILDPFYEPAAAKAPKWKLHPLLVLYGMTHLAPNVPDGPHGSYQGLAAYILIARNIPASPAPGVQRAALVLSPGDSLTDLDVSRYRFRVWFPGQCAAFATPAEWGFQHDNVSRGKLGAHADEAYQDYVRTYEGAKPAHLMAEC